LATHGFSSTPTKDPTVKPTQSPSQTAKPIRAADETARPTIKPTHSEAWLKTHGNSANPSAFPSTPGVAAHASHFRHVVSVEGATAVEEIETKTATEEEHSHIEAKDGRRVD